jgi:hypothetical protein
MTPPVISHYAMAAERVAEGRWLVDAEAGVIYGVRRQPFIRRNTDGYVQIKFRHHDDWRRDVSVLAHRVIWESEHGPVPPGLEINHRNGNKLDNRLINLEVVTHEDNVHHAREHGLVPAPRGEQHPQSKLTEDQVRVIYRRAHAGETARAIAADFPVGPAMVANIKCGWAWRHVTDALQVA